MEGFGLATKGYSRSDGNIPGSIPREDKSHLKCDYCGMTKHTKEQCFKLVGYPDWWTDGHKKGAKTGGSEWGRAAAVVGNSNAAITGDGNPNGGGGCFIDAAKGMNSRGFNFSMEAEKQTSDGSEEAMNAGDYRLEKTSGWSEISGAANKNHAKTGGGNLAGITDEETQREAEETQGLISFAMDEGNREKERLPYFNPNQKTNLDLFDPGKQRMAENTLNFFPFIKQGLENCRNSPKSGGNANNGH